MTTPTNPPTQRRTDLTVDSALIEQLRHDLLAADWTVERVEHRLGPVATAALAREQRTPALAALTDSDHPIAVLTRLFMLGSGERTEAVARALPTLGVDGAHRLGIIAEAPAGLCHSTIDLRPHTAVVPSEANGGGGPGGLRELHWWIASDLPESVTGRQLHADHVMGVGGATTSLLRMTIRKPAAAALDLGCGCGIQAMYLTTHADRVIATDISARACSFTRFNAALNGMAIDVREGSLFDPVADQRFDLIVTNPPFVITPQAARADGVLEYRDAGMDRDDLVGAVVKGAAEHLRPGGVVQLLANWEIPVGSDPASDDPQHGWPQRLEAWLGDLPLEVWAVQRDVLDPAEYAELWLGDSGLARHNRDSFEQSYAMWLDDFEQARVALVGMGFIVARRVADNGGEGISQATALQTNSARTQETPIRCYELVEGGRIPTGADVEHALDSLRLPAGIHELEKLHFLRREDITEERHFTPGEPLPSVLVLHQGGALGRSIQVGTAVSAVVGASDGELSLGQILVALAALMGDDVDDLRDQVVPVLRRLVRAGMLQVVAPDDVATVPEATP